MLDFTLPVLLIKEMITEKVRFDEVLSSSRAFSKLSSTEKKRATRLVRSALQFYFKLQFDVLNHFPYPAGSDEFFLALVALSERRYLKEFTPDEFEEKYCSSIYSMNSVNKKEEAALLNELGESNLKISKDLKENKLFISSLYYEIPMFYCKKIFEENPENAEKILSALSHRASFGFVRIPEEKEKEEILMDRRIQMIEEEENEYFFSALPLTPVEVRGNGFYPITYLERRAHAAGSYPVVTPRGLMISATSIYSTVDLALRWRDYYDSQVVFCYEKDAISPSLLNEIQRCKTENIALIHSTLPLLKTYYNYDSFDVVSCLGKGLNAGIAKRTLGVFPSIEEREIKENVRITLERLEESANFVKTGGKLLYTIFDVDLAETKEIVDTFLKNHPDFGLIADEFVLDPRFKCGYYAWMEKLR